MIQLNANRKAAEFGGSRRSPESLKLNKKRIGIPIMTNGGMEKKIDPCKSRRLVTLLPGQICLLLMLIAAIPSSSALTLNQVDGVWGNPTPDDAECYLVGNSATIGDENIVGYGDPSGDNDCPDTWPNLGVGWQSGFGFNGVEEKTILPGAAFSLGTFRHRNNPISASPVLTAAELDITLDIEGAIVCESEPPESIVPSFTYTMNLDETSNSGTCPPSGGCCPGETNCCDYGWYRNSQGNWVQGWHCDGTCTVTCSSQTPAEYRCCGESGALPECPSNPCAYSPCNSPCPDMVDWEDPVSGVTFCIGDDEYTLEIIGFIPGTSCPDGLEIDPSDIVNQFVTQESTNNQACLYGRLTGNSPRINIEKWTNGIDVESEDDEDLPVIHKGCPVTWTYYVTNTGNIPLTNVVVTDDQLAVNPQYQSGDVGNDGIIGLTGETWVFTAPPSGAPVYAACDDYTNEATVTAYKVGYPFTSENQVTDSDPSWYHGGCADAGDDISVCEDVNDIKAVTVTGEGTGDPDDTYVWTTSGTGSFLDATLLTTEYTPSLADITAGSVTLTLTPNSECSGDSSSDSMTLTIFTQPLPAIEVTFPHI